MCRCNECKQSSKLNSIFYYKIKIKIFERNNKLNL